MLTMKTSLKFLSISYILFICSLANANEILSKEQQCIEIVVYHFQSAEQIALTENYLQKAFLPALHHEGVKNVGVFKPVGNDTSADKRIFVIIPYGSLKDFEKAQEKLLKDNNYLTNAESYFNAPYNAPAYTRMERILLKAFPDMPFVKPS